MAIITGTYGADNLKGTSAADTIYGYEGNDVISAGAGNDTLVGGAGDDRLTGGAGNDIFGYDARQFGNDTITDFTAGDKIDLRFLNVADLQTLDPYITELGDSVVIDLGYGGDEESITLRHTTKADLKFLFNGSSAPLVVTGTDYQSDVLFGGKGADRLMGYGGDDELNGGAGNDRLTGGTGNDLLRGGAGADIFRYDARGFGVDTIADFAAGDTIDLRALHIGDLATLAPYIGQRAGDVSITLGYGSQAEQINIPDTTKAQLSFLFDTSTKARSVTGTDGSADVLFGGRGDDHLSGLAGDDQLNGGSGDDVLVGGYGNDLLRGGAGSDVFEYDQNGPGSTPIAFGADTIVDFSAGDRIDLSDLNIASLATLAPYIHQDGSDVVIDLGTYYIPSSITVEDATKADLAFVFNTSNEDLVVRGLDYQPDVLFGGNGDDVLFGYGGDDQLNGGGGADVLIGGQGADILRGGAGADQFTFQSNDIVTYQYTHDQILDFSRAEGDKIDLSQVDADPDTYGSQALHFVTGSFTAAGQVMIVHASGNLYELEFNMNSDFSPDFTVDVTSATALAKADLIL